MGQQASSQQAIPVPTIGLGAYKALQSRIPPAGAVSCYFKPDSSFWNRPPNQTNTQQGLLGTASSCVLKAFGPCFRRPRRAQWPLSFQWRAGSLIPALPLDSCACGGGCPPIHHRLQSLSLERADGLAICPLHHMGGGGVLPHVEGASPLPPALGACEC